MASNQNLYPADDDLQKFINYRKRTGSIWRGLFLFSLFIAILVLIVLLINIINQAFGYVAIENEITPESLILSYNEGQMLDLPNTASSEDDGELVDGIIKSDDAVGFFGYGVYLENSDDLKLLSVDGVLPTAETVADNSYPLSRPLYIYTSQKALEERPEIGMFISHYLANVGDAIGEVGYFPAEQSVMATQAATFETMIGEPVAFEDLGGEIQVAGSSTVYPLSRKLLVDFRRAGFGGKVGIESVGTTAGIRALCAGDVQIANASRPMTLGESATCASSGYEPIEIVVGIDALAVVANTNIDFIDDVSQADLRSIFTEKNAWNEVDPSYPSNQIVRQIPGGDSGTLDFFAEKVFGEIELESLPTAAYIAILEENVSRGRGRALERDQRFLADRLLFDSEDAFAAACADEEPAAACSAPVRSHDELYDLVVKEVVVPQVQNTWPLYDSIFKRSAIEAEAAEKFPNANIEFKSWLNGDFLTNPQSSEAELAGVRTAIRGTLLVVVTTFLFSFPIGVGAAIYMEEYADHTKWFNKIIQTNISNLAGVPSIIYGMLGLTVFVRVMLPLTSGQWFGQVAEGTDPSGRTVISAGLTLGLLILPIIIINAQEAIRAVPGSIRRAGMGLGATKWQTTWSHVLPQALPGILTGTILAMSRAVGETAPLIVVGASTVIRTDPTFFSRFTVLPIQIYQWTSRPQAEFQNIAAAAIVVLLIILLTLNASAVILRNRFSTSS